MTVLYVCNGWVMYRTTTTSVPKLLSSVCEWISNNIDLRKLDFLSPEKISKRSRFVNKDISQS